MLFKQKGGKKYGILMTSKEKLAQALFTLNFLDLRLDHTKPAATLHFQNTILSENYTPGQMIADNTPVWWENAITIGVRALNLGKVMLLSFQMMDNTTEYQEDMSKKGKKRAWFDIDPPREDQ